MKACSGCGEVKPLEQYHRTTRTKTGRVGRCKNCKNLTGKHWRVDRAAKASEDVYRYKRSYDLARTFGITLDDYEVLFDAQGGVCAICRLPERKRHQSGRVSALAVDHDHETGVVRGLLCNTCNRAIGLMSDDPALLSAAAAYLEDSSYPLVQAG